MVGFGVGGYSFLAVVPTWENCSSAVLCVPGEGGLTSLSLKSALLQYEDKSSDHQSEA